MRNITSHDGPGFQPVHMFNGVFCCLNGFDHLLGKKESTMIEQEFKIVLESEDDWAEIHGTDYMTYILTELPAANYEWNR